MVPKNKFYNTFFGSKGNQKPWFVLFGIFLPLFISIIFSVWGTVISIKSNRLSDDASKSREQMDILRAVVKELKNQNELIFLQNKMMRSEIDTRAELARLNRTSNAVQWNHFSTVLDGVNEAKIPKLAIESVNEELVDGAEAEFV